MSKNLIPTINISSIVNQDFNSNKSIETINKIKKACINIGFFQVIGHEISKKNIKNICNVGNKFFNSSENNKRKLAPKKWNYKNKNVYRGYFPNDVNGKEGLDIGDLKVTKKYASNKKNKYIEYINLNKSFDKKSIKILAKYFDQIFILGETLFKSIIKLYNKDKKNADILNYLGYTLRKTGNLEQAETYYLKGLELDSKHLGINEYLGELYVQTNRIELAKERLEVLKGCNCEEYEELKELIEKK